MENINNALLHIKAKHNGEIPYQYGSRECAKLMHSYAEDYHQAKLKLLSIADVGRRSEQLACPACKSKKIEIRYKEQSFKCKECKEGWAN